MFKPICSNQYVHRLEFVCYINQVPREDNVWLVQTNCFWHMKHPSAVIIYELTFDTRDNKSLRPPLFGLCPHLRPPFFGLCPHLRPPSFMCPHQYIFRVPPGGFNVHFIPFTHSGQSYHVLCIIWTFLLELLFQTIYSFVIFMARNGL